MTDWQSLLEQHVLPYRDAKRFAPATWDTAPIRMNCLHSEIGELEEALEDGEMWPIRYEMADIVCYSLSLLYDLGNLNWSFRTVFHGGARKHSTPAELTAPLRKQSRAIFEFWRRGQRSDVLIGLELLIVATRDLRDRALGFPSDIGGDIFVKLAKSASRPACHGKDARS